MRERERERKRESVVSNFAFVPVFTWRNSFVLVSYTVSFLVARHFMVTNLCG